MMNQSEEPSDPDEVLARRRIVTRIESISTLFWDHRQRLSALLDSVRSPDSSGHDLTLLSIVSLYLPQGVGVDNPITADPIGVDKSGHTTWRWGVGAASGTLTVTSPGLAETSGAPLCLLIV